MKKQERILRVGRVVHITGLSRTTIWRRVRDGQFPPPIRLGGPGSRATGWRAADVKRWLDACKAAR